MLTPEQEEYRKQQRQEAEEQMDQFARNANAAKAMPEDGVDYAPANADVPETTDDTELTVLPSETAPTAPTEERRKDLRKLYANDNEGYKQALAREGFDNEETNGVQSIQQAYYSGKIDKNTRDYMLADTIAKFARNTGRDIGNIGAQFTGGAINNNYETSEWNKRNSALAGNETTARLAEQEGSEANLKRQSDIESLKQQKLNTEKGDKALEASRVMEGYKNDAKRKAEEYRNTGKPEDKVKAEILDGIAGEYALLTSASTSDVGTEEHVGNAIASIGKAINAGLLTREEGSNWLSPLISMMGKGGTNINLGGINLDNSSNSNSSLDNPTANDLDDEWGLDKGVSNDIRRANSKFDKLAKFPTKQGNFIRDLYQGKGGNADRFKLASLVANNKIDPNRIYFKDAFKTYKGSDIIAKVEKWSNDDEFLDDYKYYTNGDLENSEAIQNINKEREAQEEAKEKERAAKEEANRQAVRSSVLNEERLPQDATPEQIQAKIDEIQRGVGSKGQKAASRINALKSLL